MPGQKFPKDWYDSGLLVTADTLDELARRMDVPATALENTVHRYNTFARKGNDEDYGRGRSAYDNYRRSERRSRDVSNICCVPRQGSRHSMRVPGWSTPAARCNRCPRGVLATALPNLTDRASHPI